MKKYFILVISFILITTSLFSYFYFKKEINSREYYIFSYQTNSKTVGFKKIDELENLLNHLSMKKNIIYKNNDTLHISLNKYEFSKLIHNDSYHKNDYNYSSSGIYDLKNHNSNQKTIEPQINSFGQQMSL